MSEPTPAELALQAEVLRLRERISELESRRQVAEQEAEERNRGLLAAAQEEKDKLAAVLSSISDEVWFADARGKLAFVNPPGVERFNLGEDRPMLVDLAARLEVFLPDGAPRPISEAPALRALRGELVRNQELIVRLPETGQLRYRQVSAAPVRDSSGNTIGSVSVVRDVTEQRQAEEALQKHREWLNVTLNSIGDAVLATDVSGKITFVNPVAEKLTGWTAEEALGKAAGDVFRIVNEQTGEEAQDIIARVLGEGRPIGLANHTALVTRGGQAIPSEDSAAPIVDRAGKVAGVVLVFHDVTARRREQAALAASHAEAMTGKNRLQALIEALPIGVALLDAQGGTIACNRQFEEVWGGPPPPTRSVGDYVAYKAWWAATGQPVQPEEWASARAVLHGETILNQEIEIRRFDGVRTIVLNSAAPIRDGEGRIAGSAVAIRDITELKRVEQSLKENEAVLRSFFDSPGVMRGIVDLIDGRIVHVSCNAVAAEIYGVERGSISGKTIVEAGGTEEIAQAWAALYRKVLSTGEPVSMEYSRPAAEGGRRWLLGTACYLGEGPSGHPRFGYTCLDMTDRKRAEEELRLSNAVLEAFFSASPGILNILDEEFRYLKTDRLTPTYFNLSREEIVGRGLVELAPDFVRDYGSMMREVMETGRSKTNMEVRSPVPGRSGELAHWLASYFPVPLFEGKRGIGIVGVEVTEIRKTEERLRQAQKLESLGLLAGGVAHDFNNLLVGVIGNAGLALDLLPPGHPAAELVAAVMKTGEQAAHLTRQMLAYSGKGKFLLEVLDVSALVHEITELIRPSISKKAMLHFDLGQRLPPIEADRGQVQQILMNLVINASEAIGSHDGLITIRTEAKTIEDRDLRLHPESAGLEPGPYVVLEVHDTGSGMTESVKAKIFDPFFSTKFTGRGLGLAAVAGIMRGHKGAILVTSEPGKGSTFTVLFPAAARPVERRPGAAPIAISPGSGVVLVIDDERIVRQMAQKGLERYGYTVLLADGGPAAIEIFKRHPGRIDVAILDLSMPGLSGEETLPELRKIRPEVKVVVSSGYSEADAMTMFQGQRVYGFIQKPYTATTIVEKVKLALT